jgi:L-fuconolactonase
VFEEECRLAAGRHPFCGKHLRRIRSNVHDYAPSKHGVSDRPRKMIRVDAHQHYWSLGRGDYAWLTPSETALYRDFEPQHLSQELAQGAIKATVLIQAAPTEAESRFLLELSDRHPSIAGIVGWVDFEASDVAERISSLVRDGRGMLKGLRPMVQDISDSGWLDRPGLDAAFEAMIVHDLAFDALVTPKHLSAVARRLRRHPRLRAILDHAGKPDISSANLEAWAAQIEELARDTKVSCKLSGLLTQANQGAGIDGIDAAAAHVFDCFGVERLMWGSDWPVVTLRASYREWLEMSLELVRRHAPGAEHAIFGANAVRFYRLDVAEN